MYFIDFSQRAQKFLDNLDFHIKERIEDTSRRLENNPVPSDAKFIGRESGEKIFRYRIVDYRALYSINENKKIILVIKIDKRSRFTIKFHTLYELCAPLNRFGAEPYLASRKPNFNTSSIELQPVLFSKIWLDKTAFNE